MNKKNIHKKSFDQDKFHTHDILILAKIIEKKIFCILNFIDDIQNLLIEYIY